MVVRCFLSRGNIRLIEKLLQRNLVILYLCVAYDCEQLIAGIWMMITLAAVRLPSGPDLPGTDLCSQWDFPC